MIPTKAAKALRMLDTLRADVAADTKALDNGDTTADVVVVHLLAQVDACANVLQHMLRDDVR